MYGSSISKKQGILVCAIYNHMVTTNRCVDFSSLLVETRLCKEFVSASLSDLEAKGIIRRDNVTSGYSLARGNGADHLLENLIYSPPVQKLFAERFSTLYWFIQQKRRAVTIRECMLLFGLSRSSTGITLKALKEADLIQINQWPRYILLSPKLFPELDFNPCINRVSPNPSPLSSRQASLLCFIYNINQDTGRSVCAHMIEIALRLPKKETKRSLLALISDGLIDQNNDNSFSLAQGNGTDKMVKGLIKTSPVDADMAQYFALIYHHINDRKAALTVRDVQLVFGHNKARTLKLLETLRVSGLIKWSEVSGCISIAPGLGCDETSNFDSPTSFPSSSRINKNSAEVLCSIYNFSCVHSRAPTTHEVRQVSQKNAATLRIALSELEEHGVIFRDRTENIHYIYLLEGSGCDHISYPRDKTRVDRIRKSLSETLRAIFNHTIIHNVNPTIGDIVSDYGLNQDIAFKHVRELEFLEIIRRTSKQPYRIEIISTETYSGAANYNHDKTKQKPLTSIQADVLCFIYNYIHDNGISPTTAEIDNYTGKLVRRSQIINQLIKAGILHKNRSDKYRRLRIAEGFGMDLYTNTPDITKSQENLYQLIKQAHRDNDLTKGVRKSDVVALSDGTVGGFKRGINALIHAGLISKKPYGKIFIIRNISIRQPEKWMTSNEDTNFS